MTSKELNKDLQEAIELLEEIHWNLNDGYFKNGDKVTLLEAVNYRNKVYYFVKKHKKNTKLKPIITGNLYY